jgi:hypothetical protein
MMSLLPAGTSRFARLRPAPIRGLREFIPRVVNDIPFLWSRRLEGLQAGNVLGNDD